MGTKDYFTYYSIFLIAFSFYIFASFSGVFEGKPFRMTAQKGQGNLAEFLFLIFPYSLLYYGSSILIYSRFFLQDSELSWKNVFTGIPEGYIRFSLQLSVIIFLISLLISFLKIYRII